MKLVLFAVSSPYAAEAFESARRLGWEVVACVRNLAGAPAPDELPRITDADDLTAGLFDIPFVVPLIGPEARRTASADAHARGFSRAGTLVDPTAVVASSTQLGPGAYVNAGAIVGAGTRAGRGLLVNRAAALGHHCTLGDYVSVGPGAVTGGSCAIGDGAFLGVGAVLRPEVTIGAGATVGAGAVVVDDVPAGSTVVGNPARPIDPPGPEA